MGISQLRLTFLLITRLRLEFIMRLLLPSIARLRFIMRPAHITRHMYMRLRSRSALGSVGGAITIILFIGMVVGDTEGRR